MKRQHLTEPDPASGMLGESRSRVLEILQDTGAQLGVNEVAARLSLHPNTVRFHLDALVASGLVDSEAEESDLRGRPRMLYSANANSASAGRRNYRLLAEILASSMAAQVSHPREASINAGREWGRYLGEGPPPFKRVDADEATGRLVSAMEDIGFAPEAVTRGGQLADHAVNLRSFHGPHPFRCRSTGGSAGCRRGAPHLRHRGRQPQPCGRRSAAHRRH